ncbi:MAG: DinB family protein, partial [Actinomycetota bacterium]
MLRTSSRAATLTAAYEDVRAFTEELASPLSAEDQTVQSMPDVSPTKWHRAHTTWFFETFLLKEYVPGYLSPDPAFDYLFNSYYEAVGDRHPRAQRGLVSRPSAAEVGEYRRHVDAAMAEFLATLVDENGPLLDLVELGLHHEQQHQELLLMDIKHVLSVNPTFPVYRERQVAEPVADLTPVAWTSFAGGEVEVGHDGAGFAFDCEGPRHGALVPSYALADRLVTCGEWLEFMADGGYRRHELWLSEGWHTVNADGWRAPSYWNEVD